MASCSPAAIRSSNSRSGGSIISSAVEYDRSLYQRQHPREKFKSPDDDPVIEAQGDCPKIGAPGETSCATRIMGNVARDRRSRMRLGVLSFGAMWRPARGEPATTFYGIRELRPSLRGVTCGTVRTYEEGP